MIRKFTPKVLDTLLKIVEVELKIPLGVAEIKFPVTEYAKEWWGSEKAKEDLSKAIQTAEENFIHENPNNKAAEILHDISIKDDKGFQAIIADLLNHLSEGRIVEVAALKLGLGFENIVSKQELQAAMNEYLPYLRYQLIALEGFREVITAITTQKINQTTSETLIITKEIKSKADQILGSLKPQLVNITVYEPQELTNIEELPEPGQLPPGSRMPFYRNAAFTGRIDDLKYVARSLLSNNRTTVISQTAATIGMGGIGKTQLAVEFCYRYGRYFHAVHWVNSSDGRLDEDIAACGREMDLPNFPEKLQDQVNATIKSWQFQPFRLVVFDNLEDPNVLAQWLPRLSGVRILITARRQQWNPTLGIDIRYIETLQRSDSINLLRRLSPKLERELDTAVNRLAERLGDLPLALDLAGRYLNARQSLTVDEYLLQLTETSTALEHTSLAGWVKDASPTSHEASIASTFLISWQQLENEGIDGLAKNFFIMGGFLAPNVPIPHSLFLCVAIPVNEWDEAKTDDQHMDLSNIDLNDISDHADDAVLRLQQLGLLNNTSHLHPLLSEFAREQIGDQSIFLILVERMVFLSTQMLMTYTPSYFRETRFHIETLAKFAEANHLKNTSLLWNNLGQHLHQNGENFIAKGVLEKALDIARKDLGETHPYTLSMMNDLAMTLRDLREPQKAKTILEEILEEAKAFHKDDAQIATFSNNLGMVMLDLHRLAEAKQLFMRALQIDESIFGKDHPKIATRMNNIGMALNHMNDFQAAKHMHEQALEIREKNYGAIHPHVAQSMHNLAYAHKDLGNFTEAKNLFEQAIEIGHQVYPDEHPEIALWLYNYAELLNKMGKHLQAEKPYKQSIEIYNKLYGTKNLDNAYRLTTLALLLMQLNKFSEAKKIILNIVAILQEQNHPDSKYVLSLIPTIESLENQHKAIAGKSKRRKRRKNS